MALFAVGAIAIGAYSANRQRKAAADAAGLQQGGTDRSLALTERMYEQSRADLMPWTEAGRKALAEQQDLMGLDGDSVGALRALQNSPGYQFRQQQGLSNLEAGLAARGGMGSGRGMAAGQQFAQGFASNEYGNRLSQLANLSGTGQSSAAGQASAGQQYGVNASNLITGNANAQAAAGLASTNATQSSLLGGAQLGLAAYGAFNPSGKTSLSGAGSPANTWGTPDYSLSSASNRRRY